MILSYSVVDSFNVSDSAFITLYPRSLENFETADLLPFSAANLGS